MATAYFYLLLASGYAGNVSWNVTPMPSMDVCQLTLKEVLKGIDPDLNYGSVRAPSGAKCIEIETPVSETSVKDKITAGQSFTKIK